ncbi:hypothetical protein RRG08_035133 [Elysia crispata]|uniref:Uncharacterized protein n=1 Tax=Elysia crispata TaxID=231223 RepID=A0AAE1AKR0_9GAST|nr:hypothetical protein RRG08_035133 [Elysia crispata]
MNVPKRKLSRYLKIAAGICILTTIFIIILMLTLPQPFVGKTQTQSQTLKILEDRPDKVADVGRGTVLLHPNRDSLLFTTVESPGPYLKIHFPHKLLQVVNDPPNGCRAGYFKPDGPQEPYAGMTREDPQMCLYFDRNLHAAVYDTIVAGMQCHHVYWFTTDNQASIINTISLHEHNWYGGGGLSEQRWPLQRVGVPLQPYLTNKFTSSAEVKFDSFIEPYFVSSNGAALMLDSYLPLFVSINSNKDSMLVFKSIFQEPYSAKSFKTGLSLSYKVCKSLSAPAVHETLSYLRLSPAAPGAPADDLLQFPIWSSRAFQEAGFNETRLIVFVHNIKKWKLPYNHLFIVGNYSKARGVFSFNENKFPHSHQLIMEWKEMQSSKIPNLFVGVEVFPHVPESGVPGSEVPLHIRYDLSVKQSLPSGQKPPMLLDITNEKAVHWFKSQLRNFRDMSVHGFLFADGHSQDIFPPGFQQSDLITNRSLLHPNQYTEMYGEIAGSVAAPTAARGFSILGSGYLAQKHGFIADAGPFRSAWDHQKGLKAVIPTTITYGLLGYPFVLTGPVGGLFLNGSAVARTPPSQELYIRWLSLATYLPVLELAWAPWFYSQEVINHARSMLEFRQFSLWPKYLSPAVEEAAKTGLPIVRPLWWVAPTDSTAQFIDCEFMLGSRLLVAPVLMDRARSRSVYLPNGSRWKDNLKNTVHHGGQWLTQYSVGLYDIATFERL